MTYKEARRAATRDALGRRVEFYARTYRPGRPTIVLVPGGMGSHLDISAEPYTGDDAGGFRRFDPIWMDLGIVFSRDALKLQIGEDGHDWRDRVVIGDGPLQFFVTAYDGTERFFRQELGWNYIVFGYDWRREVTEAAGYLEEFLRRLAARVKQQTDESPLPSTTLVCHSMGGLVAMCFLQRLARRQSVRAADIDKWFRQVVTVGSPIYGAATHMPRYYQGQSMLNDINGKPAIARMVGSLPGPYALLPLDAATYQSHRAALAQSRYPLVRYPIRDFADDAAEADPYDRRLARRYPPWVAPSLLRQGRRTREMIAGRLPPAFVRRLFHLRSGQGRVPVEQRWRDIDGSQYDPNRHDSPLSVGLMGPGDGTIPAWAARHVQTPLEQVYDLRVAAVHEELMEHRETLTVLQRLVADGRLPGRVRVRDESLGAAKASARRVSTLVADARAGRATRSDERSGDAAIWRRVIEETSLC